MSARRAMRDAAGMTPDPLTLMRRVAPPMLGAAGLVLLLEGHAQGLGWALIVLALAVVAAGAGQAPPMQPRPHRRRAPRPPSWGDADRREHRASRTRR